MLGTQKEAIKSAKSIAINQKAVFIIHDIDEKIRDLKSY
ncbi:DUF2188 domain-containing protein [Mangrovibacillus cuniculi]